MNTEMALLALLALLAGCAAAAAPHGRHSLAPTPPRGWLSWGRYRCFTDCALDPDSCIGERLVLRTARALVDGGYAARGYTTVNIDSCWASTDREPSGEIVANTTRFPRGLAAVAEEVHALNLSLGLYTNMGSFMGAHNGPGLNCSRVAYEADGCAQARRDIDTMTSWGIDFLKIDGDADGDAAFFNTSYPLVDGFLAAGAEKTGRGVVYSCSWPAYTASGHGLPIQYGLMRRHCNMWRNYEDIQPTWPSLAATIEYWGSLGCVDNDYHRNRCVKFPTGFKSIAGPIDDFVAAAGPGGWNDPDQVLVGQTPCPATQASAAQPRWMRCEQLSRDEERTQLAIWAVIAAPVLLSVDVEKIPPAARADLLNEEVLAVNDDALGRQGRRVSSVGGAQVWVRPLQSGAVAVALHNAANTSQRVATPLSALGLGRGTGARVRDLFERQDSGTVGADGTVGATVAPHGVALLSLTPLDSAPATKTDDRPAAVSDAEQHDCGPRGVRPLDCARFPRWDVAAAHPPTPAGLETVTIAAAPSAPPPAGPPPEHSAKLGYYNHGPYIADTGEVLVVNWYAGWKQEDGPGERVMYSTSATGANGSWSAPRVMFPRLSPAGGPNTGAGSAGIVIKQRPFATIEGRVYGLADVYNKTAASGQLSAAHLPLAPLMVPVQRNGSLGAPVWLADSAPSAFAHLGWRAFSEATVDAQTQADAREYLRQGVRVTPPVSYVNDTKIAHGTQPAFVEEFDVYPRPAAPGSEAAMELVLLLRCDGHLCQRHGFPGYRSFWASVCSIFLGSGLGGGRRALLELPEAIDCDWPAPAPTDIPHAGRSYVGQLPDGRAFMVGNQLKDGARDPLTLSVSSDGVSWGKQWALRSGARAPRFPASGKGAGFDYPGAVVSRGRVWVAYSDAKEDIELTSLSLDAL